MEIVPATTPQSRTNARQASYFLAQNAQSAIKWMDHVESSVSLIALLCSSDIRIKKVSLYADDFRSWHSLASRGFDGCRKPPGSSLGSAR